MIIERLEAPPDLDGTEGLIAIVVYAGQAGAALCAPGVHFLTERDRPQQVALIRHPAGHVVPPHTHRRVERTVSHTAEVLLVRRGAVLVDLYTSAGELCARRSLKGGDVIILLSGGHSLLTTDETEIIEVKQGPYLGREQDKIDLFPGGGGG